MFNELEPNEALGSHHQKDVTMPKFGINNPHFFKFDVDPMYLCTKGVILTCSHAL
jgi:hypothetical protein